MYGEEDAIAGRADRRFTFYHYTIGTPQRDTIARGFITRLFAAAEEVARTTERMGDSAD
jgi:hypothetical protein